MADIHLYTPEGGTSIQSEERVAQLVEARALDPGTLFWQPGMPEWISISSFPRVSTTPPRPRTTPLPVARPASEPDGEKKRGTVGRNRFRFRRNPEPLTTIVQVLLVICICLTMLELGAALVRYTSISAAAPTADDSDGLLAPPSHDDATGSSEVSSVATDGFRAFPIDDSDDAGRLLQWLGWSVNVALIVPYFMWLYRTVQNCRNFSAIMRYSPEWAVWCYFIPPIFFFRPLQVMQEVWKVSRNPRTWHNDRSSHFVRLWWVLTLATLALALSSCLHSLSAETHSARQTAQSLFIGLKVVQTAWYVVFLALVTQVIKKQMRVVHAARRKAGNNEGEVD